MSQHIVIAERYTASAKALKHLLESSAYTTHVVVDSQSLLEYLMSHEVSQIILATSLEDMSGIEAIALIRHIIDTPPPIVVVAAEVSSLKQKEYKDAGAAALLDRSTAHEQLVTYVQQIAQ